MMNGKMDFQGEYKVFLWQKCRTNIELFSLEAWEEEDKGRGGR